MFRRPGIFCRAFCAGGNSRRSSISGSAKDYKKCRQQVCPWRHAGIKKARIAAGFFETLFAIY
jgi:hypothetical protein